jgi:hypothetical protein
VEEIGAIGESPDKEDIHRCLVHRDIGDPGDKVFMHFGFAKSETPTGRKVPPCGQLSADRKVGIREIGNPVGKCFAAFETP